MRIVALLLLGAVFLSSAGDVDAKCADCDRDSRGRIKRGTAEKNEFKRETGHPDGRKGYIVDHKIPLACGGTDDPSNMQWQRKAAAKAKDRVERKNCQ